MNHAFLTRRKFNKGSKFLNRYNFTGINLSFFKLGNYHSDNFFSFIYLINISATDAYISFIRYINLNPCLIYDGIDCLTLLTDYFTNLIRINLNLLYLRCIFIDTCPWLCYSRLHTRIHNEHSGFFSSCYCTFNYFSGKTMNLDIHLNCCDTVCCTGYLKVHISEEIFKSLNICKQYIIIICITRNQTAGNTRYHLLNRYTRRHK